MIRAIIYGLAILVITGWAVVYFKYQEEGYHLTLAVAIVAIVFQWIPGLNSNQLKNGNHESRKRSIKER